MLLCSLSSFDEEHVWNDVKVHSLKAFQFRMLRRMRHSQFKWYQVQMAATTFCVNHQCRIIVEMNDRKKKKQFLKPESA